MACCEHNQLIIGNVCDGSRGATDKKCAMGLLPVIWSLSVRRNRGGMCPRGSEGAFAGFSGVDGGGLPPLETVKLSSPGLPIPKLLLEPLLLALAEEPLDHGGRVAAGCARASAWTCTGVVYKTKKQGETRPSDVY